MSATGCAGCSLSRQFEDRFCAGRADLPPAYGDSHPLRRLPADGGKSCRQRVSHDQAERIEAERFAAAQALYRASCAANPPAKPRGRR